MPPVEGPLVRFQTSIYRAHSSGSQSGSTTFLWNPHDGQLQQVSHSSFPQQLLARQDFAGIAIDDGDTEARNRYLLTENIAE